MTQPNNQAKTRYPVLYGSSRPFPSIAIAGGFRVTNNVQLISERVERPRQWVITCAPMTANVNPNATPWYAPSDGTGTAPPLGTAPFQALSATPFQVLLGWGAGGVRSQTRFDYPVQGGTFGLLADTLDLNVIDPSAAAVTLTSLDYVPWFAAFMVPGVPSGRTTMRYTDVVSADLAPGASAFYSIKPFAREVWISNLTLAAAAQRFQVRFLDGAGVGLWNTYRALDNGDLPQAIPVSSGACFMEVTNLAANVSNMQFRPMWNIELS